VGLLKEFFFDTLKELSTSEEIEEGELIRVSKLLIKYFDKLSQSEKEHIREQYLGFIIPQFSHSDEVLLYSLLVVLREQRKAPSDESKLPKFKQDTETIMTLIVKYLNNCSEEVGGKRVITKHINSVIELMYQIQRHELPIPKTKVPSLLGYNFDQKQTIGPEVVSYLFSYLTHST
jgi:hypothetical protein